MHQVTRQYEERFAELRTSPESECRRVVDDTVSFAQTGMEGFKKEESAAMTELREECKQQENRAAELNAQLQDRVDELMEKLNKYSAPVFQVEEVGKDEEGIPVEVYATPRTEHAATAGVDPMPQGAMSNLADNAKERLQSFFSTTPAGSNAPPTLPPLPVRQIPHDDANREPSVRSPTIIASEPDKQKAMEHGAAITSQQLVDLITRLTSKEGDGEKPRTKEAESIKLNDMPAPETYRQWRNHVRDEVKSCSDKPDEAWSWLNEVFDTKTPRVELEKKLQEPGKFITLDTKLSAALTRSAKGDLATKIHNFKDENSKKGIQVRGRRVLLMFEDYFKTSEEAGSLYRVEDLLGVVRTGDTVDDLKRFSQQMGCNDCWYGDSPR